MLAPAMKENLTRVELAGRIHLMGNVQVEWGEKRFKQWAYYADPSFTEILELKFLYGQAIALADENQVVLSESLARKIFDDIDVVDELIEVEQQSMRVAGVYRDIPSNTHRKPAMLVSMVNMGNFSWDRVGHVTYVRLEPGIQKEVIDERLEEMVAELSIAEPESGIEINFTLYPVKEIYMSSDPEQEGRGSRTMIYVLSSIAIFLLLIASINYINMATARASSRSREIGVRKVIGADRSVLVRQFLVEAYVIIFISVGLGLGLAILLVDELIVLTSLPNDFQLIHGQLLFMILFLGIILGLLAGLYPAYVLSSFRPYLVLKGMSATKGGKYLRRILVTFQFTMSVILILCTLIVLDQMDYIRNKDLGYNREGIYALTLSASDPNEILKSELMKLPEVKGVTATNLLPATGDSGATFEITNESGETSRDIISMASIDGDYQDVMEINLLQGNGISEESGLQSVIVNETLVAKYGWKDPIGKNLNLSIGENNESFQIIGIVQDFNMLSLHEEIKPFAFFKKPKFDWGRQHLLINLSSNDLSVSLDRIRSIFEEYDPDHLFQGRFLADHLLTRLQPAETLKEE
ncbi:macB [Symbiodinium microadriaticum]|nr:macB [Symbiodinium microadriaticum]